MGRFNFKGNLENVGSAQLDYIGEVLEKMGYKGPEVSVEPVGAAGDNYIANVKRIVIHENGTTFKMIAKLASAFPMMRETMNTEMLFYNEHVIYMELLPKFKELQKEAGVPKEEWFRFPECYGSSRDIPNEVILLEDLKESNHVLLDRFKSLNHECVKFVLKNLAIFHSLSLVLKNLEPEKFAELKDKLRDMLLDSMAKRKETQMFMTQIEQEALSVLQEEKYKKCIRGSTTNMIKLAKDVKQDKIDPKYLVLIQGDGWTNNLMFQMDGETPKSCILIDYQMAREGSPAFDIIYALFNSTHHEQRQKYYHDFIDYYHSEMAKSLKYYNLDISTIYPRHQLDSDLKTYAKFTLAASVMVTSLVVKNSEDASKIKESIINSDSHDMEKTMESMESVFTGQDQKTMNLFRSKLEGLVDSFLEFDLLEE